MTPFVSIRRMRPLPASAMYRLPLPSLTTPLAPFTSAAVAAPPSPE
ncbi:MAG: hypothetical protein QM741_12945 [Rudaea sp.]